MTDSNSTDERTFALHLAARGHADRKARPPDPARAQARRATFRRFLADCGVTRAALARMAGLSTANALYNFTRGQTATLSLPTLEAIQRAIPGATIAAIIGEQHAAGRFQPAMAPAAGQPLMVPILCDTGVQPDGMEPNITQLGAVQAGVADPAHISVPIIPVPPGIVSPTGTLFAVRVTAPGAEHLFAAGSLLVCRRMPASAADLPDGTRVILHRRARGTTRIDVREIAHFNGQIWLWPRSTHPEHQQPHPGPEPLSGSSRAPGSETITIIGVVLASWQPAVPATTP